MALFPVGLFLLGISLDGVPAWVGVKESLRRQQISKSELGSLTLVKILRSLDRIHPDFRAGITAGESGNAVRSQTSSATFVYRVDPLLVERMPSSLAVPERWRLKGLPLLSLAIGRADYAELLSNPRARGKEWERLGYVSYFDRGELLFGTGVGARIQGEMSRLTIEVKSFRIYFREKTGHAQPPPGLLLSSSADPIRRLVAHNDIRWDRFGNEWHFIRPLAYDIFRRIGVEVPEVSPAWFLLNGEPQGVYILTEHFGADFLETRFGHSNFVMIRDVNPGSPDPSFGDETRIKELRAWVRGLPSKLPMKVARELIDVENLSRWFAAVLFCGTTDALQQPLLLNLEAANPRWFWMAWDLDHSFKIEWGWKPGDRPADVDIFQSVLKLSGREKRVYPKKLRSLLLSRLIATQEYRKYLAELIQELLNHQLTLDFLHSRLAYYDSLAAEFGVENETFARTMGPYFSERPEVLRHQMQRYLKIGESHRVHINVDSTCPIEVDGYRKVDDYNGWYIDKSAVQLRVDESCRKRFLHWEIRKDSLRIRKKKQLKVIATGAIEITAVLGSFSGTASDTSAVVPSQT